MGRAGLVSSYFESVITQIQGTTYLIEGKVRKGIQLRTKVIIEEVAYGKSSLFLQR